MLLRSIVVLSLVAVPLSGCLGTSALAIQMGWEDANHAWMMVTNEGDSPVDMTDIMREMRMNGPDGDVPMYWGGLDGDAPRCWMGRDSGGMGHGHMGQGHCGDSTWSGMQMHHDGSRLQAGETWRYHMHAIENDDGTWGMMVSPAAQDGSWQHMHNGYAYHDMEPGTYTCRLGGQSADATLES